MKLVLLGTTGYHPNDQRHTACLMLPEQGIVLDAGTAMFRVRDHLVTPELDVFVTHAHLDHIVGLTYLFDIAHERDVRRISIHGAAEKLAAIRTHLFAEPIFPVLPPCDFRPLDGPVSLADGGKLSYFPLEHPGGSLGFRLDWPGRSLAYVTDTIARPAAAYAEQVRGVDVLVHECYFPDAYAQLAEKTGHSWTTPVLELAARANVGRLILVHVNPIATEADPLGLEAARQKFPRVELGYDGMEVEF